MKTILLGFFTLFFVVTAFSQNEPVLPPYKRFPAFPPVKLLLPDSVSFFTKDDLDKKSPVMLMLFSPQCDHCKHETEDLIKNIDKFKDIQVIMATSAHFDSMVVFREKYKLAQYSNLIVAKDFQFFLPTFFAIRNMPFFAFYNRKKVLLSVFEGTISMDAILKLFKD